MRITLRVFMCYAVLFCTGTSAFAQTLQLVTSLHTDGVPMNDKIIPESGPDIRGITAVDDKLFFSARTDTSVSQLWSSDGTAAGTQSTGASANFDNRYPALYPLNGKAYYVQGNRLWVSDGTSAGTQMVSATRNVRGITGVFLGKLFLEGNDPVSGTEIWVSDGTEAGTKLLKDINPNADASNYVVSLMLEHNGKVYFNKDEDGTNDINIWVSDGTEAGTTRLKDIHPSEKTIASVLAVLGDRVYFTARRSTPGITELWSTDGTEAGTVKVHEIPTSGAIYLSSLGTSGFPQRPVVYKDHIYFMGTAETTYTPESWRTDGTAAGTEYLGNYMRPVITYNDKLLMAHDSGRFSSLYITDGTVAGTRFLAQTDTTNGYYGNFRLGRSAEVNGRIFFLTTVYAENYENYSYLWQTDGTPAGTFMSIPRTNLYEDWFISIGPVFGKSFAVINNELYFPAFVDTTIGYELYKFTPPPPPDEDVSVASFQSVPVQMHIFPNPAQDELYIALSQSEIKSVEVISMNGQLQRRQNAVYRSNAYVSLQGLAEGLYLVRVQGVDGGIQAGMIRKGR